MDARAADPGAGQPSTKLTDRQGGFVQVVPEGPRLVRGVLEEIVANCIAQLVVVVLELGGAAIVAALEPDNRQACLGQLGGDDPADPADSDDRNVDFLVRHGYIPPISLFVSAFAGFFEPVAAALDPTPAFAYLGMSGSGLSA